MNSRLRFRNSTKVGEDHIGYFISSKNIIKRLIYKYQRINTFLVQVIYFEEGMIGPLKSLCA
jgi:hypothetical protein